MSLTQISEGILGSAVPVPPSDLNDKEWAVLAPRIPPSLPHGRPRSSDRRWITYGVCSIVRSGCAWHSLSGAYGARQTVSYSCRQGRRDGTWVQLQAPLRALTRLHAGRDLPPSAAVLES
jgi:putative transposase